MLIQIKKFGQKLSSGLLFNFMAYYFVGTTFFPDQAKVNQQNRQKSRTRKILMLYGIQARQTNQNTFQFHVPKAACTASKEM